MLSGIDEEEAHIDLQSAEDPALTTAILIIDIHLSVLYLQLCPFPRHVFPKLAKTRRAICMRVEVGRVKVVFSFDH